MLNEGPEFLRDMVEVTATRLTMKGRPVWRMLGVTACLRRRLRAGTPAT